MTIYILKFIAQDGQSKSLAFSTRELADSYGESAILAGDISGFYIQTLNVITEID